MLIELHRKGGALCEPAKLGQLHCPLIVRPTSEDNITAHLVHTLRSLNPRHWVSDFLNTALNHNRFPRQVYRCFRLEPWVGKPCFPRELLHWKEGRTQVDIEMTWENPPTTVFVECKYGSPLSPKTNRNDGSHGYPADQLVRNIRVGLHDTGRYATNALFETVPRDFVVIVLAPEVGESLVQTYRDPQKLVQAIPHSQRITSWPQFPFVGEIGYAGIRNVLRNRRRFYTRGEQHLIDAITEYLTFKLSTRPQRSGLPMAPDPDEHS